MKSILYVTTSHRLARAFNSHTKDSNQMFFTTPGAALVGLGPFDIILYEDAAIQTPQDQDWFQYQVLTRGTADVEVHASDAAGAS